MEAILLHGPATNEPSSRTPVSFPLSISIQLSSPEVGQQPITIKAFLVGFQAVVYQAEILIVTTNIDFKSFVIRSLLMTGSVELHCHS
jgi:hypothetical protein